MASTHPRYNLASGSCTCNAVADLDLSHQWLRATVLGLQCGEPLGDVHCGEVRKQHGWISAFLHQQEIVSSSQ